MTIPELSPQDEHVLQRLKEDKASEDVAPIERDANDFIETMTAEGWAPSPTIERDASAFITSFVSWSSKNADSETGCIPIATFDLASEKDTAVDSLGLAFLTQSSNVQQSQVVSEEHLIDKFDFHQPRLNGAVQAVTVFRKEPLMATEAGQVEYYLKFEKVGQRPAQEDAFLAGARMYLENVGREGFALAAQGMEIATRSAERPLGMVRSLGGMMFGRPSSPESEE